MQVIISMIKKVMISMIKQTCKLMNLLSEYSPQNIKCQTCNEPFEVQLFI